MPLPRLRTSRLPAFLVAAALAAITTGCGQMPRNAPTPAASPPASSAASSSKPQAPALGALVDRMDAAWAGVTSYRATFTGSPVTTVPGAGGTPAAGAEPFAVTQEFASPERRRQVMTGAGRDNHEVIVDGPVVSLRGPLADSAAPGTPPDRWIVMPGEMISPETDLGHVLAGFVAPPRHPLSGVGENLRPQALRDLGPREVDGRTCRAWGAADTTEIGARLDITIVVDGRDLPCLLETRVGPEVVSTAVYDAWGEQIEIAMPVNATAVTPVAGTPRAHD